MYYYGLVYRGVLFLADPEFGGDYMKMRKMLGLVLVVCLLVSMVSVISSGTVSAEVFDQNGNVVEGIEGV